MKSLSVSQNLESNSIEMENRLARITYRALVSTVRGKIWLGGLLVILFIAALSDLARQNYIALFAGIILGFILFSPTLIVLFYFDRRERESWVLTLLFIGSVIFFFGPVIDQSINFSGNFLQPRYAAGFIEEFWKVVPLILLLFFAPRAVNGIRDGLIYGALGGLGFAIWELATRPDINNFPVIGWVFLTNALERGTLLGTHNHVIWSATIGAALAWTAVSNRPLQRFIVSFAVYLSVAGLHIVNDLGGAHLTTYLAGIVFEPIIPAKLNSGRFVGMRLVLFEIWAGTINLLVINIVLLPILFRVLCSSGDIERRVIREQLDNEIGGAITRQEFEGVVADRRYRTRRIEGWPPSVSKKIVQMQNELAFHKMFAIRYRINPDTDLPVMVLRKKIAVRRFEMTNSKEL